MKPVNPSSMISGTEPLLNAMTGVPQAIASINTKPKGSGQAMGASSAMAPLKARLFAVADLADILDVRGREQLADFGFEIVAIDGVDLGCDLQWHPTALGYPDRLINMQA